jgi:hypothetical protein
MVRVVGVRLVAFIVVLVVAAVRADGPDIAKLRSRLRRAATSNRPRALPRAVLTSIDACGRRGERIAGFPQPGLEWAARAAHYLERAERGEDPYPLERGKIVSRGYRSPISQRVQGYTVYVPPDYTPTSAGR